MTARDHKELSRARLRVGLGLDLGELLLSFSCDLAGNSCFIFRRVDAKGFP